MIRIVSVNVGRPRRVEWNGSVVTTSIFKDPVEGPVRVEGTHVTGDVQANPSVHGGPTKSVYAYPSEHYAYWQTELGGSTLPFGAFGENLTLSGVVESDMRPGDRLRVGECELNVTQPRFPCEKLAFRFQRDDMVRAFAQSGRCGFYLGIARPGVVRKGDEAALLPTGGPGPSIGEMFRTRIARERDAES